MSLLPMPNASSRAFWALSMPAPISWINQLKNLPMELLSQYALMSLTIWIKPSFTASQRAMSNVAAAVSRAITGCLHSSVNAKIMPFITLLRPLNAFATVSTAPPMANIPPVMAAMVPSNGPMSLAPFRNSMMSLNFARSSSGVPKARHNSSSSDLPPWTYVTKSSITSITASSSAMNHVSGLASSAAVRRRIVGISTVPMTAAVTFRNRMMLS